MNLFKVYSVILFLFILSCNSNKKNTANNLPKEYKKTERYYKLVYEAEELFMQEKYSESLKKYFLADKYISMFRGDAENALKCAIKSENYKESIYFVNQLMEMGYPISFFEKNMIFEI